MVLLNSRISSELIFPPEFRIFNIGDNIELVMGSKRDFYKILNRNTVPFIEKQDTTNWLLAAAATYNAGDINDWLEPENDVLMILAMSMYSDRNMELRITLPSSDKQFGTKKEDDPVITPEISPWKRPAITLYSYGATYVPSFHITNPTEYTNLALKIGITGHRYKLEKLPMAPETYSIVNLGVVRD